MPELNQPLFGVLEAPWEFTAPHAPVREVTDHGSEELGEDCGIDVLFALHDGQANELDRSFSFCTSISTSREEAGGRVQVTTPQHVATYALDEERVLTVAQHDASAGAALVFSFGAGMTRKVALGDVGGLLTQGQWSRTGDDDTVSWSPTGAAHLVWSVGNRVISLSGQGLNAEELLALAQNVRT